jgi:hypothetical protein
MPKKSKLELSASAEAAFSELFDSNGKLNPPPPTAAHLLKIERQVTGRKKPGELTLSEAADCYRLLQADYLLSWYKRYCKTGRKSV